MHFDVVFLDPVGYKYYDRMTLEKEAMGGTEATIVRIAEGLAQLGLKVAVVQPGVNYFEPIMGQHCFFLHVDDIPDLTCKHFIQLRTASNSHLFPMARKYLWLHDIADNTETESRDVIEKNNITIIGVSRWHRNNIKDFLPDYDNIKYIYNPVHESLYETREPNYHRDKIVWTASPHKGLRKAIDLFKVIKQEIPKMELIVFNPGYKQLDNSYLALQNGVNIYGPMNATSVWSTVRKSLCVFYPTQWDETFGLIAAEANAMGVPIATFKRAALKEIVSSDNQFAESDDDIIQKVINWSKNGRPEVSGRDEFKYSDVIMEWVRLLAKETRIITKI